MAPVNMSCQVQLLIDWPVISRSLLVLLVIMWAGGGGGGGPGGGRKGGLAGG